MIRIPNIEVLGTRGRVRGERRSRRRRELGRCPGGPMSDDRCNFRRSRGTPQSEKQQNLRHIFRYIPVPSLAKFLKFQETHRTIK